MEFLTFERKCKNGTVLKEKINPNEIATVLCWLDSAIITMNDGRSHTIKNMNQEKMENLITLIEKKIR